MASSARFTSLSRASVPRSIRFGVPRPSLPTVLIIASTLAMVFVWQVENYRGWKRWQTARAVLIAQGQSMEWRDYFPKPIPDEDNVAAHPFIAETVRFPYDPDWMIRLERLYPPFLKPIPTSLLQQGCVPLKKWKSTLQPDAVLSAAEVTLDSTSHVNRDLDALGEALARPQCIWVDYDGPDDKQRFPLTLQMPDCSKEQHALTVLLCMRAKAHLVKGRANRAAAELVAAIRLSNLTADHPALTGPLVCVAMQKPMRRPLVDALSQTGWDDRSLRSIAEAVRDIDLLEHLRTAAEAEFAAFLCSAKDFMNREEYTKAPRQDSWQWRLRERFRTERVMPRGWHYQNIARVAEYWQAVLFRPYDVTTKRLRQTSNAKLKELTSERDSYYNFMAKGNYLNTMLTYESSAKLQSNWDLFRLGCHLKRYRLDHGHYPASLDGLVPDYLDSLPHDYLTGKPPFYERNPKGGVFLATLDWDATSTPRLFPCQLNLP